MGSGRQQFGGLVGRDRTGPARSPMATTRLASSASDSQARHPAHISRLPRTRRTVALAGLAKRMTCETSAVETKCRDGR
ncbi:hypothetical protein BCR44DRAFT_1431621 [Catenaria anguillulae PL171]|uniref:Uncharacterized protein n=1 Tax=Catenaria anguillulae PL171 TaxID=765915 RepID=A0A1Y2HQ78_9FUNG|nr:hypothetical protein BCR44DRAFT_1431621 [Catenaria anguillulae PL171]